MKSEYTQISRPDHRRETGTNRLCPALPVLDQLQWRLGDLHPSVSTFFGLQHLFGSTATLVRTLSAGGIEPDGVFLLGKPYSANRSVVRFLQSRLGYQVHPESCEQSAGEENDLAMDRRIESVLDSIRVRLEALGDSNAKVLLVDDGGRAIRMLHTERYTDILDRFSCVEQTRCGIRALDDVAVRVPVVNVAESWAKLEHESPMIADSVLRELSTQLAAMESAGIYTGRRALVIGYGAIGSAVAAELRRRGRDVTVYDADRARRVLAQGDGYRTLDRLRAALAAAELVIGCTGKPVLDRSDYAQISDGAILVSASSADVEFRAWQLRPRARCLGRPESWLAGVQGDSGGCEGDDDRNHPCFSLYQVANGDRSFYLVNGGFPVNFNGGVDPIPPRQIQLTRSLLYIGAIQASRTTETGVQALEDRLQRMLMDSYAAHSSRRAA